MLFSEEVVVTVSFNIPFNLAMTKSIRSRENGKKPLQGPSLNILELIAQHVVEKASHFILAKQKQLSEDTTYYKTTPDGRLVMEIVDRKLSIYVNFDNKGDKIVAKFDATTDGLITANHDGTIDSF